MPGLPQRSLSVGLDALFANPLRTLLSTLGVVMGVAAMVAVLSMGDGAERFAREQMERTTDLLAVAVTPRQTVQVDGQFVRREDIVAFTAADARGLAASIPGVRRAGLGTAAPVLVTLAPGAAPRGFTVRAILASDAEAEARGIAVGRWFTDADTAVVVLSARAASAVAGDSASAAAALGRAVGLQGEAHRVIGVLAESPDEAGLEAFVPVTDAARALGPRAVPQMTLTAERVEDVEAVRAATERWAAERFGPAWGERLTVATRRGRVEQAATGMRIFKLLMGAITGVSLLVGGVGIMNVLLASVAERTREIGIRKATGARDRDILVQFLSESVAITASGAALGVATGLAIAHVSAWVMRSQTQAPIYPAVTAETILFAAGASVLIGLVFGLYPARRAARLSPIDAIRHE